MALPVVLGTALSASMEMAQVFVPGRVSSIVDLVDNIAGCCLGVIAALLFTRGIKVPAGWPALWIRDRASAALLFCWIAFLVFPLFPVLSLPEWKSKFLALISGPIDPLQLLLSAAEWFAAGHLLMMAGVKSPVRLLLAMLALVPLQVIIADRNPMPADLMGAAAGATLFYAFARMPLAPGAAGVLLLIALTLRGLAPFYFSHSEKPFSWIPFVGFFGFARKDAIPVLLSKSFQYGSSIWLLCNSGYGIVRVTVSVTLLLSGIEALQMRVPGHVPEITDPLLAIGAGVVLASLREYRRPRN